MASCFANTAMSRTPPVKGMETKLKGGSKVKLPDYQLSGQRDIDDGLVFTTAPTGTVGTTAPGTLYGPMLTRAPCDACS